MSRREPVDAPRLVPDHTCALPRWLSRAILVMAAVQLATLVALGIGAVYVYQANQYVAGRGEYRDMENDRTNQRINDAICDLLDQLPEGGLLERPRAKYGCGPGIPIDQLPQEIQDQLADRTPRIKRPDPEPADAPPPVPAPSQDIRSGVQSSPEPAPAPEQAPPPLVDLGPVTDLCEATGVCG